MRSPLSSDARIPGTRRVTVAALVPALLGLAALCVPLALTGCASRPGMAGELPMGPGGRIQGVLDVAPGSDVSLRLENLGPGRADFVIRQDGGATLQEGPLGTAQVRTSSTERVHLIVVIEAYDDAGTSVAWDVASSGAAAFDWDLSGQFRGGR